MRLFNKITIVDMHMKAFRVSYYNEYINEPTSCHVQLSYKDRDDYLEKMSRVVDMIKIEAGVPRHAKLSGSSNIDRKQIKQDMAMKRL